MLQIITIRHNEAYKGRPVQLTARIETISNEKIAIISRASYFTHIVQNSTAYRETVDGIRIFAGKVL